MNSISVKFGYWSAIVCILSFIVFTICFVIIAIINPIFTWTNLSDYLDYVTTNNQLFKHIAQFAMIVFAISYVIMLNSIHEFVKPGKKVTSRLGMYFGIAFMIAISIHYFIQITAVRLSIPQENTAGLEQFVQANPVSASASINMLGWTIFFGLSTLFISFVFSKVKLEKTIKYALLFNGIICLTGGIGYVFNNILIIWLTMNLGMGAAVMVASISLLIYFKRLQKAIV